jgi:hypothetical protein
MLHDDLFHPLADITHRLNLCLNSIGLVQRPRVNVERAFLVEDAVISAVASGPQVALLAPPGFPIRASGRVNILPEP